LLNPISKWGFLFSNIFIIKKVMSYTLEQIKKSVESKGYVWFNDDKNKGYDVNIVGIRNAATGQKVTNAFDDYITISYKENGEWKCHVWPATTDPGKKGVMEYHNKDGVARLVEGQYRGSHIIRLHQGKYEALGQDKPVKVYRDANKDMNYDENKITEGVYGINIHKAGADSTYVENWSEGCQVFKKAADFEEFMKICRKSKDIHGNRFTYTLIETTDIK
jgi:hypothetical protein